jgi:hypothetical protein
MPREPHFVPLTVACANLGVPLEWLRDEVDAGRLPALFVARSRLVHLPSVLEVLLERSKSAVSNVEEATDAA